LEENIGKIGTLYICGTPIGNLEDITLRVIRILGEVDLVASEDTRRTVKLLEKYSIKTPQTSYHKYSNKSKAEKLIDYLKSGKNIALVSDAGMPGISDPGEDLITLCIKENIPVIAVPGPSSVTTSLVLSGLPSQRFVFEGFLPRDGKMRRRRLRELKNEERTIILYLTPHRACNDLKDILSIWGDRAIFWGRELTKKFEECWRGKLSDFLNVLENKEVIGEITLVVEGYFEEEHSFVFSEEEIIKQLNKACSEGMYGKEAIKKVASITGVSRNDVYKIYLSLKDNII
jgi:16S rRNA (cytidine1402-2'-O)-methyltransferase